MTTAETTRLRAEIAAVLEMCPYGRLHSRLRAIDAFVAGQSAAEAAAIAQVRPGTLLGWLRLIRTLGITTALGQWHTPRKQRHSPTRADPARLRACAVREKHPSIRKRILAVANLAEGMSVYDAAAAAGASTDTVYTAMRRFQREGVAGLRNRASTGRRVKLAPDQLAAVANILCRNPEIGVSELRLHILTNFGVSYTPWGLKNMLKKQLGVRRRGAAFQPVSPTYSPQTNAWHTVST